MRTIIRLQRQGPKNAFYYKIVCQGSYRRLQSNPVEHLGYWFPKKINEHDRSVVLNKNRIRYWIANGAQLSFKIQRFLSYVGMYNEPWIPFGKSTMYKTGKETEDFEVGGINKYFDEYKLFLKEDKQYIHQRNVDMINPMLRKIKFLERIKDYFDDSKLKENIEKILTEEINEDDTRLIKTHKFKLLKEFYNTLSEKDHLISSIKREYLHKRMNELAKEGLMNDEEYKIQKVKVESDIKDLISGAFKSIYEDQKQKLQERLQFMENLNLPISESQFSTEIKSRVLKNDENLDENIKEYIKRLKVTSSLTKMDVENFLMLYETKLSKDDPELRKNSNNEFFPMTIPLTPYPKFTEYDPNDWFDLKEQGSEIRNNLGKDNNWHNTPLSDEMAKKKDLDHINFWDGIMRDEFIEKDFPQMSKTEMYLQKQKIRRNKKAASN